MYYNYQKSLEYNSKEIIIEIKRYPGIIVRDELEEIKLIFTLEEFYDFISSLSSFLNEVYIDLGNLILQKKIEFYKKEGGNNDK
jgi:hypothetical protein